jgi:predicted nucleotidyltransferase
MNWPVASELDERIHRAAEGIPNGNSRTGPLEYEGPLGKNEEGRIMVTLDALRREKKAEIIRLAQASGCSNVRVFGSVATGENRPDSDVDFLVDLDSGRTIFDLARSIFASVASGFSTTLAVSKRRGRAFRWSRTQSAAIWKSSARPRAGSMMRIAWPTPKSPGAP